MNLELWFLRPECTREPVYVLESRPTSGRADEGRSQPASTAEGGGQGYRLYRLSRLSLLLSSCLYYSKFCSFHTGYKEYKSTKVCAAGKNLPFSRLGPRDVERLAHAKGYTFKGPGKDLVRCEPTHIVESVWQLPVRQRKRGTCLTTHQAPATLPAAPAPRP